MARTWPDASSSTEFNLGHGVVSREEVEAVLALAQPPALA